MNPVRHIFDLDETLVKADRPIPWEDVQAFWDVQWTPIDKTIQHLRFLEEHNAEVHICTGRRRHLHRAATTALMESLDIQAPVEYAPFMIFSWDAYMEYKTRVLNRRKPCVYYGDNDHDRLIAERAGASYFDVTELV